MTQKRTSSCLIRFLPMLAMCLVSCSTGQKTPSSQPSVSQIPQPPAAPPTPVAEVDVTKEAIKSPDTASATSETSSLSPPVAVSTSAATSAAATRANTFQLISWNVQTFGKVQGERETAFKRVLPKLLSSSVAVFAAEEVARQESADLLTSWLPGNGAVWGENFQDSTDAMDNGIWVRKNRTSVDHAGFLFTKAGSADRTESLHPAFKAQITVEDFDFTLIALHLTYKAGDAVASKKELENILNWMSDYLKDPKNDPDVIVVGDFNLPSRKGKTLSARSKDKKWVPIEDMLDEEDAILAQPLHLTVFVDNPTSRGRKKPSNNYDHLIVTPHALGLLVSADRVDRKILDDADADLSKQISDHYPIVGTFKCRGPGIHRDIH